MTFFPGNKGQFCFRKRLVDMPHLVIGKRYRNMDDIMHTFSCPFPAEKCVTKGYILYYILSRANAPKNVPFSHAFFSTFSTGKILLLTQCPVNRRAPLPAASTVLKHLLHLLIMQFNESTLRFAPHSQLCLTMLASSRKVF